MARAGNPAGFKFLPRAHVQEKQRACGVMLPGRNGLTTDELDPEALGNPVGSCHCHGISARGWRSSHACCAPLATETGNLPSHGSVRQGRNAVGNARIPQRLATDDASRTPGAIHDHERIGVGHEIMDPVHELRPRHVSAARNGHSVIFVVGTRVEDHDRFAAIEHRLEFLGTDCRRLEAMLDVFAKRLRRHVHAAE